MLRLGVLRLDQGAALAGFAHLANARAHFERLEAHRLLALAWAEEGLYRILQGRPERALAAFDAALEDRSGSRYVERIARFGRALALRVVGADARAERERAEATVVERLDEPGVFALRALERRIAGEPAEALIEAGLARHALRPNPADAALVLAVGAALGVCARDDAEAALGEDGPAFALALVRAARGDRAPAEGQALLPVLVAAFR
jgi:hypothetical protein